MMPAVIFVQGAKVNAPHAGLTPGIRDITSHASKLPT
jgi:hypothetical protein